MKREVEVEVCEKHGEEREREIEGTKEERDGRVRERGLGGIEEGRGSEGEGGKWGPRSSPPAVRSWHFPVICRKGDASGGHVCS